MKNQSDRRSEMLIEKQILCKLFKFYMSIVCESTHKWRDKKVQIEQETMHNGDSTSWYCIVELSRWYQSWRSRKINIILFTCMDNFIFEFYHLSLFCSSSPEPLPVSSSSYILRSRAIYTLLLSYWRSKWAVFVMQDVCFAYWHSI